MNKLWNILRNKYLEYYGTSEEFHRYFSSDSYDIHEKYTERGMDETSQFIEQQLRLNGIGFEDNILEIGCNMGRHLNYLFESGYRNLVGVELNKHALDTLSESYPDLFESGKFYQSSIESYSTAIDDNKFDATFSITVFQHISEDNAWVFREIARITSNLLITIELEEPTVDNWVYEYRNYGDIFQQYGFDPICSVTSEAAPVANHLKQKPHIVRIFQKCPEA